LEDGHAIVVTAMTAACHVPKEGRQGRGRLTASRLESVSPAGPTGKPLGLDIAGEVERLPGVPELDGYGNRVQRDVGRAELGAEVIAVLPDAGGDLAGRV